MTEKKGLSLCVVTLNDEKFISHCLSDLKDSVDELIVVDIGSSDQTTALAKHAGAHVFEYDWQESFSEVKNFCMEQASGRWILFLQANEALSDADLKKLPLLMKNPNVEGYLLEVAAVGGLKMVSPNSRLRLIRNRKDYRFCYRAFEQIPDEQICNIENSNITIHSRENKVLWALTMRDRLLEQDIAQYPEAHYIHYVKGLSLFRAEKFEESAVCFENACEHLNPECLFAAHLFKCRAWCLLSLARYSEAQAVLDKAIACLPLCSDFLVLRAETNKQLGDYNAGISSLMQCLNTIKQTPPMAPAPDISASIVWESLGIMLTHLANLHQALACFQQAYYLNSHNSGVFERLCALAPEANMPEALTGILSITLKQNIPRQLVAAAKAFFLLGQYDKALALVSRISDTGFEAQVRDIKFNCYLMVQKDHTEDLPSLDDATNHYNLTEKIKCCWLRDETPKAEALLKEWTQAEDRGSSLCAIYCVIQDQLSGDRLSLSPANLTPGAYREIRSVHDMLLINGETKKAKSLLPLLLKQNKDLLVELALLWARANDFNVIKQVFKAIAQEDVREEFKYRVLRKLICEGHFETAKKLLNLRACPPSEEMQLALWCARVTKKLEDIRHSVGNEERLNPTPSSESAKPLMEFYEAVREANVDSKKTTLPCGEIQCQIGADFEQKQKKEEAIASYLRALKWGISPTAQNKICAFAREEQDGFKSLLEAMPWTPEGELFRYKDSFCEYIRAMICFDNAQFKQAYALFAKVGVSEPDSPASSYMQVILWLVEKRKISNVLFNNPEVSLLKKSWCFNILKNLILEKLEKALKQNQYNGLFLNAKESVLKQQFP